MGILRTPHQGNQGRTSMGPYKRLHMQPRIPDAAKETRLRHAPNLDTASMLSSYGLAAAGREIVAALAEHRIGAVQIKSITLKGNAVMVEIHHFSALDQIPPTETMKDLGVVGLEVSPTCVLAWRKPKESSHA